LYGLRVNTYKLRTFVTELLGINEQIHTIFFTSIQDCFEFKL